MSATLDDILAELQAIRLVLSARPAPAATHQPQQSAQTDETGVQQPSSLVSNPGDVQVHFGKNNGTPLHKLTERQLGWYAKDPEPRLDSSGKPYPPRPQDVALRNACRQRWHQTRGTLIGAAPAPAAPAEPAAQSTASDEEVPF